MVETTSSGSMSGSSLTDAVKRLYACGAATCKGISDTCAAEASHMVGKGGHKARPYRPARATSVVDRRDAPMGRLYMAWLLGVQMFSAIISRCPVGIPHVASCALPVRLYCPLRARLHGRGRAGLASNGLQNFAALAPIRTGARHRK